MTIGKGDVLTGEYGKIGPRNAAYEIYRENPSKIAVELNLVVERPVMISGECRVQELGDAQGEQEQP